MLNDKETSQEAIRDATKHCHPPTQLPNRVGEDQATETHHHTHYLKTSTKARLSILILSKTYPFGDNSPTSRLARLYG